MSEIYSPKRLVKCEDGDKASLSLICTYMPIEWRYTYEEVMWDRASYDRYCKARMDPMKAINMAKKGAGITDGDVPSSEPVTRNSPVGVETDDEGSGSASFDGHEWMCGAPVTIQTADGTFTFSPQQGLKGSWYSSNPKYYSPWSVHK